MCLRLGNPCQQVFSDQTQNFFFSSIFLICRKAVNGGNHPPWKSLVNGQTDVAKGKTKRVEHCNLHTHTRVYICPAPFQFFVSLLVFSAGYIYWLSNDFFVSVTPVTSVAGRSLGWHVTWFFATGGTPWWQGVFATTSLEPKARWVVKFFGFVLLHKGHTHMCVYMYI